MNRQEKFYRVWGGGLIVKQDDVGRIFKHTVHNNSFKERWDFTDLSYMYIKH